MGIDMLQHFYAPSTKGFYNSQINAGKIPNDAIQVTKSEYLELVNAPSVGKSIRIVDGRPVAVTKVLNLKQSIVRVSAIYEQMMLSLRSSYTNSELHTFPRKSAAAEAFIAGTATTLQKMYLAKLEGVLNGLIFATESQAQEIFDLIQSDDPGAPTTMAEFDAAVEARAQKILAASVLFDTMTAEAERLRKVAESELQEGQDNTDVLDGLKSSYENLMQQFTAIVSQIS